MAQCQSAFFIKNTEGRQQLVPCNKCPNCKARRVSSWSHRLLQEERKAVSAYFITLTYNDENLPITKNGYRTLKKKDLQLFFKRLRKSHTKEENHKRSIRYFAVGEYGGKIGRPHYHVILFNANIRRIQQAWSVVKPVYSITKYKRERKYGITHRVSYKNISSHIGHVHYGDKRGVSGASVGYTLKYILKPKDIRRNPFDDSAKEFTLMSKGIGIDYLDKKMIAWHKADLTNRMYVNIEGGKKASMSRYYKDKLYTAKEREQIAQQSRIKLAEQILEDLFKTPLGKAYEKAWNKKEAVKAAFRKQNLLSKKTKEYV